MPDVRVNTDYPINDSSTVEDLIREYQKWYKVLNPDTRVLKKPIVILMVLASNNGLQDEVLRLKSEADKIKSNCNQGPGALT